MIVALCILASAIASAIVSLALIHKLEARMSKYDDLLSELRTATDGVSARLDKALADVKAKAADAVPAETFAAIEAEIARLKAMGTDPNNPTAEPAPATEAEPVPAGT